MIGTDKLSVSTLFKSPLPSFLNALFHLWSWEEISYTHSEDVFLNSFPPLQTVHRFKSKKYLFYSESSKGDSQPILLQQ